MTNDGVDPNADFVDLVSYEAVQTARRPLYGNVIKGKSTVARGVHTIEIADGSDDRPSVMIHKEQEVVEAIEFVCKCGREAAVRFDYEGE